MGVTFLAPVTGIVLAAVTMPLLTLMYILKLRRQSMRVSSILFWKAAISDLEVNVPWRRLRLSLLYLLQMLALACLCIAAAQPVDDGAAGRGSRVLLVIDRSASMQTRLDAAAIEDGAEAGQTSVLPGTRLDEAKARASRLARELLDEGDTEVGVAAVSLEGTILTRPTRDRAAVLEAIAKIQPTDQPGSRQGIIQAIAAAELVVQAAEGDAESQPIEGAARAIVLSDGVLADSDADTRASDDELPAGVAIRYVPIGVTEASLQDGASEGSQNRVVRGEMNLGIASIAAVRESTDVNMVRMTVQVAGVMTGPTTAGVEVLFTAFEGASTSRVVGQGTIQLVPATSTGAAIGTLPMAVKLPEGGLLTARLRADDALASDDFASVVLPAGRSLVMWLVGAADTSSGAAASGKVDVDPFLTSFAEASGARFEVMDAATFASRINARTNASSSRADTVVDLALLDRVEPPAGAVNSGIPMVSFGSGYAARGVVLRTVTAEANGQRPAPDQVVTWRRGDALMRDVRPSALEIREPAFFESVPARGRVLIEGGRGPVAIVLEPQGRSAASVHVAFSLRQSNWGADPSLVLFLSNLLEKLGSVGSGSEGADRGLGSRSGAGTLGALARQGQSVTTREGVNVMLDASQESGSSSITLRGPLDARTLELRAGINDGTRLIETTTAARTEAGSPLSLGVLERAGVYTIGASANARRLVAVNLASSQESQTWVRTTLPLGASSARQIVASPEPRALWRFFVMAGLGLAMLEWMAGVLLWRR
jgi:hypothetical protein